MLKRTDLFSRLKPLAARLGGVGVGFLLGILGNVLCLLAVIGLYTVLPPAGPTRSYPVALTVSGLAAPQAPKPPVAVVLTDETGAQEAVPVTAVATPATPEAAPTVADRPTVAPTTADLRTSWPRQVSYPEVLPSSSPVAVASPPVARPVAPASPAVPEPVVAATTPPAPRVDPPLPERQVEVRPPEPPPILRDLPPQPSAAAPAQKQEPAIVSISVAGVHATSHVDHAPAPLAGNRYVVVEISMQDAANTLQLSEGHFEVRDQAGNIYYARTDLGTPWIVISPGVTLTGNLVFEIPQQVVPHQLAFISHGSPVTIELTSMSPQ